MVLLYLKLYMDKDRDIKTHMNKGASERCP